jgi:hypothetical protein
MAMAKSAVDRIISEALQLTPGERADLAQRLFASVEGEETERSTADVERAWIEEAERRYQRYLSGESHSVSASDALRRIRSALGN